MTVGERGNAVRPGAIIAVATGLLMVGLVMVASASASLKQGPGGGPYVGSLFAWGSWGTVFARQAVFVLAGFVLMVLTTRLAVPCLASPAMRRWIPRLLFVLVVGCLLAALAPGLADPHRGSQRWLRFAAAGIDVAFQPSEPAKLAMVAFLASLLSDVGSSRRWFRRCSWEDSRRLKPAARENSRRLKPAAREDSRRLKPAARGDPRSFRGCFLPASIAIGVCVLLVGKEDFGTSVLLAAVGVLMLFVAGCRLRHLTLLGAFGACGFAVLLYAAPYRLARIAAYKSLWADPRGSGYQPLQSLTTIASGGWFGTGLGSGVQKYGYLPECHSDFIFAVICEEAGAFGGSVVIALFCAFVWLGLRAMLAARSPFERLLAFGVTATMGIQAAMNIAVVTVVTPTTGISVPLISAGGSGVIPICVATGVLAAIAARGATKNEVEHTYAGQGFYSTVGDSAALIRTGSASDR